MLSFWLPLIFKVLCKLKMFPISSHSWNFECTNWNLNLEGTLMYRCSLNSLNNLQIRFIESHNNIFSISSLRLWLIKNSRLYYWFFAHRIKQPILKLRFLNFKNFLSNQIVFHEKKDKYTSKTFSRLVIICQMIPESSDRSFRIFWGPGGLEKATSKFF